MGGREKIAESVDKFDIDEIIIAIPSASRSQLRPLIEICKETGRRIQILPGMYQIIKGDVNVSNLREVQIEDLLGRDPIEVNVDEIIGYVQNKTVLVTGGGGSIGSETFQPLQAKQLLFSGFSYIISGLELYQSIGV